jgi:hypothetical protein
MSLMSLLKRAAKGALSPGLLVLLVHGRHKLIRNSKGTNSFLDEETVIRKYLDSLELTNHYCVDIAASDGINASNTYSLYKDGWGGIALELDPTRFAMLALAYRAFPNVSLLRTKVLPDNVLWILKSCKCPADFSLLNLDIDGYDFYVLEQLLSEFRPRLVCLEINENIPPPIQFTVKADPGHFWSGDHFHGQSISKSHELCRKYDYDIVELHYNNLIIMPRELNKFASLSPEEAYDAGYKNKPDRKQKFHWNADMEAVLGMTSEEAKRYLSQKFEKYAGKFVLE